MVGKKHIQGKGAIRYVLPDCQHMSRPSRLTERVRSRRGEKDSFDRSFRPFFFLCFSVSFGFDRCASRSRPCEIRTLSPSYLQSLPQATDERVARLKSPWPTTAGYPASVHHACSTQTDTSWVVLLFCSAPSLKCLGRLPIVTIWLRASIESAALG